MCSANWCWKKRFFHNVIFSFFPALEVLEEKRREPGVGLNSNSVTTGRFTTPHTRHHQHNVEWLHQLKNCFISIYKICVFCFVFFCASSQVKCRNGSGDLKQMWTFKILLILKKDFWLISASHHHISRRKEGRRISSLQVRHTQSRRNARERPSWEEQKNEAAMDAPLLLIIPDADSSSPR